MNCPSCGQPVAEGLSSCPFCGNVMPGGPDAPASSTPATTDAPDAPTSTPSTLTPAAKEETPQGLVIGAIVCSVLALLILPPLFGGIAMFLGYRVRATNEELGTNLMIVGGLSILIGAIIGIVVLTSV
jgi:hypothetical protein